ncbi:2011_t:CDS:2 [Acaulospora morrowiae]|uniref:2011_t:CDS:1 n=1 Tax=Acaulospora morrowiae TaxID=94023 RepID=A0A9N8WK71_9GLOM|nr:2011_t:CDS:2 [Acaulospora morrowiae]
MNYCKKFTSSFPYSFTRHKPNLSVPNFYYNSTFKQYQLRNNHSNYMRKYAQKLQNKAKSEGFSSVEELKTAKLNVKPEILSNLDVTTPAESLTRRNAKPGLPPNVKSLDKILNMDKIIDQSPEIIGNLWTEYYSTKSCLSAVIPAETYKTLFERGQQYPMFIAPLPQNIGLDFYILQFQFHQCYFTSLLEYKTHGSEARQYLALTHFPDLMDSKGIVLMHGELLEPKLLSLANAQYLTYFMQKFYVTGTEEERALVERFHKEPDRFDYNELLKGMNA